LGKVLFVTMYHYLPKNKTVNYLQGTYIDSAIQERDEGY